MFHGGNNSIFTGFGISGTSVFCGAGRIQYQQVDCRWTSKKEVAFVERGSLRRRISACNLQIDFGEERRDRSLL